MSHITLILQSWDQILGFLIKKDKNKDDNTKKSLLIIFSVPSSEQFLVIKCFFNTEVCPSGSYMLDNFPGPCEKILAEYSEREKNHSSRICCRNVDNVLM